VGAREAQWKQWFPVHNPFKIPAIRGQMKNPIKKRDWVQNNFKGQRQLYFALAVAATSASGAASRLITNDCPLSKQLKSFFNCTELTFNSSPQRFTVR